jgi:hypothetical protein
LASTWRILNTSGGQNGTNYSPKPAPDSSKIYIRNPYGALGTTQTSVVPNSFINPFFYKSSIKPSGIERVVVGYQAGTPVPMPTWFSSTAPVRTQQA